MAVLTVTSTSDYGTGSLRQAISAAESGDIIEFDASLEDPQTGVIIIGLSSALTLGNKQVTVDGGETWTDNGVLNTRVVLDAQADETEGNQRRVATCSSTARWTFNGVTFKNGYVVGLSSNDATGAAVYMATSANCFFNHCVFDTCKANNGGAFNIRLTANCAVNNCLFTGCEANNGGALYLSGDAQVTINHCTFSGCKANSSSNLLYFNAASFVITDTTEIYNDQTTGASIGHQTSTGTSAFNGNNNLRAYYNASGGSMTINGKSTFLYFTTNGTVTFSGVDSILAVTTTATIGSATFTAAEGATGYAAFPTGTDTSAASFTGVKVATYSTSTPTISATIGETRTANVEIKNADAGYIIEVVYSDGVVGDITIDDGSAVIAVDKAFKIRLFNGAFYESALVPRTYYLKAFDADGDFATATDWTLDADKALTCNAAPTIKDGVFYCTQPAEG